MAMIFITHDLGVVAEIADRIVGDVCRPRSSRAAPAARSSRDPQHPYTLGLLELDAAARRGRTRRLADDPAARVPDLGRHAGRLRLRAALRASSRPEPCRAAGARRSRSSAAGTTHRRAAARRWREIAVSVMHGRCSRSRSSSKHFPIRGRPVRARGAPVQARRRRVASRSSAGETLGARRRIRLAASRTLGRLMLRLIEPTAGADPLRRAATSPHAPRRAAALRRRAADDLPGPVRLAQSAHDGGADRRRAAGVHASGWPRAGARTRRRAAAASSACHAEHASTLPARVLRRPAPAHRHRPRAGARARS